MKPKNIVIIDKILEEIVAAESFVRGFDRDTFLEDERTKRAVCMTIINIGELVKNIDDSFKDEHTEIPWKAIAGFRDIAAHKYQTLRMEDVFITATTDLPELHAQLEKLVSQMTE